MTACWLCVVLLSSGCLSLHLPSLSTHRHTPTHTHTSPPHSPSRGTTLVTVDINTLLCHWERSAQEWKYLTGTIYRPCRRTGGIHGNTIQPILESCSTEIASAEKSCKAQGLGAQLGHGGERVFYRTPVAVMGGECCCGVYRWKRHTCGCWSKNTWNVIFMQVCIFARLCVFLLRLFRPRWGFSLCMHMLKEWWTL